jgi:hypothetical protein
MNKRQRNKKRKKRIKLWNINIDSSHSFYLNYHKNIKNIPAYREVDLNLLYPIKLEEAWEITKPYIFNKGRKVGKTICSFAEGAEDRLNYSINVAEEWLKNNPKELEFHYDKELIEEMKNFVVKRPTEAAKKEILN